MSIVLHSRPISGSSNWNAAGNPILYKFFRNDFAISQLNNAGGFAQVQINGTNQTSYYQVGNSIVISLVIGSPTGRSYLTGTITASSFSGGNTLVTTTIPFADLGGTNNYFNNLSKRTDYKLEVEVFKSSDNTSLTGGVKFTFTHGRDGLILVDVSAIVKNFVSAEWSNPAGVNEVDSQASIKFYIKYQEYYDGALQGSVISDSANPVIAVYAAMQVGQSAYGGNMRDYYPASDQKLWLNKFHPSLALNKLVMWRDWPFTVSFIWPTGISALARRIRQLNSEGIELATISNNLSADVDKIHRIKVSGLDPAAARLEIDLLPTGALNYFVDSSLTSYAGWANAALSTIKWLFAGINWGFTTRTLRSGVITPTISNGTSILVMLVVSQGQFKSTTVTLRQSSGSATQALNFGDLAAGTHNVQVIANNNYDVIDIQAQCTESQLTNGLTLVKIDNLSAAAPINLDNNTFTGTMDPWVNQGEQTNAWSYGNNDVVGNFGPGGNSIRYLLETLDSPIAAGSTLSGEIDIDPNVGSANVDIVIWDGSSYQVLDTIAVLNGPLATYAWNGIASINGTHFGFTATRTDGLTSPASVRVSRVTLNGPSPYVIPDSGFAAISSNWQQLTLNFPWTQGGGEAQILLPSSSFAVYFLQSSTSDSARKTVSIPSGTEIEFKIIADFVGTGIVRLTLNFKNSGNATIHSFVYNIDSANGERTIIDDFDASDTLTTVELIAVATSGTAFLFKIEDIEVYEATNLFSTLEVEVRDVCNYNSDNDALPGRNPIHLFWKSIGGDHFWNFGKWHEYDYTYQNGRKAKRIRLFEHGLDPAQWEALNDLNTVGEVYQNNIIELTSSVNKTSTRVGQQVYMISKDGTKKTGVIVIPSSDSVRSRSNRYSFFIEIELPEIFGME